MRTLFRGVLLSFAVCMQLALPSAAQRQAQNEQFEHVHQHFERVASERFATLFQDIDGLPAWNVRRQAARAALKQMLWHEHVLPTEAPTVMVTHREPRANYTLECLVLETFPGIYSTANLYLPNQGEQPHPVVLYQCGHANKSYYARHGAWFASHGIAALVMDNIEMGEIEITHHGVYSHAWFDWYSRGYSPLAVELINAIRALDYLCSRPDLDKDRIGATGRSGGGMTTFYLAALDERVLASAPVSGTLSTKGWVERRLASAHCDCQYQVNSHGLMYSEIGALTAPRAQLLCNAAEDRGFPQDSFLEMADKMREIYRLYGASESLQTATSPGGHSDTEAIRLPVFNFFLKELLGAESELQSEGPIDVPPNESLICFRNGIPLDEQLTNCVERLFPVPDLPGDLSSSAARTARIAELTAQLQDHVFRYFPQEPEPLEPIWSEPSVELGRSIRRVSFQSFDGLSVRGIFSLPDQSEHLRLPAVLVVDHRKGIPVWGNEQRLELGDWGNRAVMVIETVDIGGRALERNLRSFADDDPLHHLRREAMVVGTTLESMQVYEILRSLSFLRAQPQVDPSNVTIVGRGHAGINGLYAALLDDDVTRVIVNSPPASHLEGPCYLGILRYTDVPEVLALMHDRLKLYGEIRPWLPSYFTDVGLDGTPFVRSLQEALR